VAELTATDLLPPQTSRTTAAERKYLKLDGQTRHGDMGGKRADGTMILADVAYSVSVTAFPRDSRAPAPVAPARRKRASFPTQDPKRATRRG
jgi:hypothetical protein